MTGNALYAFQWKILHDFDMNQFMSIIIVYFKSYCEIVIQILAMQWSFS